MATGLRCLIEDKALIARIKVSLNNIANMKIAANSTAKITAKELYNTLSGANVDIDLESVAALYSEAFASSIGVNSNFETEAELLAYKTQSVPLKDEVKKALLKAGFGKMQKNGKEILDWVKLMRKSQQDIEEQVAQAVIDSMPAGTSAATITAEVDAAMAALKGSWKQILSNALIKAQNTLKTRNTPVTVNQKNSIDKIADSYAEGLFDEFKDEYENAVRKAVGVSGGNRDAMAMLDELGKMANALAMSPYGTNNILGQTIEAKVNEIISKAQYKEAPWIYKFAKGFSLLMDFIALKTLNNPWNRAQNYSSGKIGLANTAAQYGKFGQELRGLASAVKKDIIRNGGEDFSAVNNMLYGDRSSDKKVRSAITNFLTNGSPNGRGARISNWMYSQIMGTAALNGVDNYNKVLNTWARFISGMEEILVSKGMTKGEAQKTLHEEIFGKKWEQAREKAEKVIAGYVARGFDIPNNNSTIERFAADIIKVELVQNQIITENEMSAAWDAGHESAGREMGHVPNNIISFNANAQKQARVKNIDQAVRSRNYKKAAGNIFFDTIVSKIFLRFVSGGMNWVVLKLEKGGVGIVRGIKGKYTTSNQSFKNLKTISQLTPKEIEQSLYEAQRRRDEIVRGTIGGVANVGFLLLGVMALGGDEDKKRRERLLKLLKDHFLLKKVIQNFVPLWLAGYISYMQQNKIGWSELDSKYKRPIVDYALSLSNMNPDYMVANQLVESVKAGSSNKEKSKNGIESLGKMLGNYIDINPLPTKFIYDGINIYNEITGATPPYKPAKYTTKWDAFRGGVVKYGIGDKLFNFKIK